MPQDLLLHQSPRTAAHRLIDSPPLGAQWALFLDDSKRWLMKINSFTNWLRSLKKQPDHGAGALDLLVSCSQSTLRIALNRSGLLQTNACAVVATGAGLYYGLARAPSGSVWLASRRALVSDGLPSERERGQILSLATETTSQPAWPNRPLRDLHGMAYREGILWVTCSYDDCIGLYNLKTSQWNWWQPLPTAQAAGPDQYHFNTVVFESNLVWVLAHRRGPSWLLAFPVEAAAKGQTVGPVHKVELGQQAHNIWRQPDGELCTCSSIEGRLVGERGWHLETGGFPRGVAQIQEGWVVGISELKERKDRDFSDAQLKFFNQSWEQTAEVILPAVGMVLDIMPIPKALKLPTVGTQPLVVN